jgi:hypothetical protein
VDGRGLAVVSLALAYSNLKRMSLIEIFEELVEIITGSDRLQTDPKDAANTIKASEMNCLGAPFF